MKYFLRFAVVLLVLTGCNTENNDKNSDVSTELQTEESEPELSKEELEEHSKKAFAKVLDVSTLNLVLNGDSKWVISEEAFTKLMKVKQQIYAISGNMENYTEDSYNEISAEFLDFLKDFPVQTDSTVNAELQKVIDATKDQCVVMLNGDLQNAQISVINLSLIYDEVPEYFEYKK